MTGGNEVTLDYTGGTKTMTAAMVLAGTANERITLQFMSGCRSDLHQVEAGSEGPVEMPRELIGLGRLFSVARSFVENRNYSAALAVIEQAANITRKKLHISPPKSWRVRINTWKDWLYTLDAWDRFDHQEAMSSWKKAYDQDTNWAMQFKMDGLSDRLRSLSESAGKPTPEILEDLWLNAKRRAALGVYDDGLARLYRLAEATVQGKLWTCHQINTGRIDPQRLTEDEFAKASKRKDPKSGEEYCLLPLWDSLLLLQRLDRSDPVVDAWPRSQDGNFINPEWQLGRNQSILAHGFRATHKNEYEKAEKWFRQHLLLVWQEMLNRKISSQLPNQLP